MTFFVALAFSCVEPYEVRSISYDKAIVVEGRFTDQAEGHYIKLSHTRTVDDQKNMPISGASVWVQDADGGKIEFEEVAPGHYESIQNVVAGVAGNNYQLVFVTPDGKPYRSNFQELIAAPVIEKIYPEYAEKANLRTGEVLKGVQFFLNSHDASNKAQYYKYEWEETYQVSAAFPSLYEFFPNPDTVVARTQDVSPCYVIDKSSNIILGSTATLTESRLLEMPVRYITSDTEHLRIAYSILVKQYTISGEAYSFYRKIEENNDGGALFDKQLGAVVGNIISEEDPNETVLGFFEVSGVSEKRTSVKFDELDKRFPWPKVLYPCSGPELLIRTSALDSLRYYVNEKGYGIISSEYCPVEYDCSYFTALLAPRYCTDCRFRGPADKPDFWIY